MENRPFQSTITAAIFINEAERIGTRSGDAELGPGPAGEHPDIGGSDASPTIEGGDFGAHFIEELISIGTDEPEAIIAGHDAVRFATIAKLTAGRLVRKVADTCLQFHGGIGYMDETWTSRFYRDSRLLSIGGGADEVMLHVLARMDGITALD